MEPLPIIEGAAGERGLRAAHLRRAAAGRGNERAGARHHRSATGPTSSSRICSAARRRWRSRSLKQAGYPLSQGARLGLGVAGGRHQGGRRLGGGAGLQHDAVRRRRRRLSGAAGNQGDVQEGGQASRPRRWTTSVYYNRGIQDAAVHIEALRNALKLTGGKPPTGEDMKKGFEMIKDFTLGGLLPPLRGHRRPITKAAAGCRSSRSRAARWSRRPNGSTAIATSCCKAVNAAS